MPVGVNGAADRPLVPFLQSGRTCHSKGGWVPQAPVSPEVKAFVAQYVDAAEQLDILLLLARNPDRAYTAAEVSQAVFTVPASATMRLEGLVAHGILSTNAGADPRYQYAPANPALARSIEQLDAAYRADRVGVIKLIFDRPPDPVQTFADAFRFKGGAS
jgi:hypothetical protein